MPISPDDDDGLPPCHFIKYYGASRCSGDVTQQIKGFFARCSMPSYDRALWALRKWLDSWSGIGHVAVGMARDVWICDGATVWLADGS